MKKFKFLLVLFLLFGMLFSIGCGEEPENPENDPGTEEVEKKEFTISFSDGVASQKVKEGEKVAKPDNPVKEGYIFKGWYDGDAEYDFSSVVTKDISLIAKWEKEEVKETVKYNVKFYANEELLKEEEVEAGKSATAPEPLEIEGAIFVEWDVDYSNVTADLVVKAVYVYDSFLVTFIVNGEQYGDEQLIEYGKDAVIPSDPQISGYKFNGWDKESTNVKENLVVTAQMEIINYNIKFFDGTDELTGEGYPTSYNVESELELPTTVALGFDLVGWYENAEFEGDAVKKIEKGTTGDKVFYSYNLKFELNGGTVCWETNVDGFDGTGIDAISNLPEMFELDFFTYLKNNNLLTNENVHETMRATTWEKFSGLNPNHNGDPKRIWNDTSTNSAKGADGYVALFLFDSIELDANNNVVNITGGFLGTEPYKTKYRGLTQLFALLHTYRVTSSSKYTPITNNTASTRALTAFVIDGYFYGTQGVGEGYFAQLRKVIPGTDFGYVLDGANIKEVQYSQITPMPVKAGYSFVGWYTDEQLENAYDGGKIANKSTLYAKWEEVK